ncbi:sigma factor-like helix-turn-helix DNA-binding protein [Mycoplasmopsis iners]|uniref:sigma factor-like helix-turn-helix DNA-binding protein n=1 Tax=Mycoplasmopsis iners TaxID=76630 RepID=UPI00049697B7|nr:sigma factor-like helix-turn-helix DNA-binding protein [Mycoplasmopsis iners]
MKQINLINEIDEIDYLIDLFENYQDFLTQTQKQAFMLYFYENLSYQEIANETATTRSAAYDSVKKAIQNLKKIGAKLKHK